MSAQLFWMILNFNVKTDKPNSLSVIPVIKYKETVGGAFIQPTKGKKDIIYFSWLSIQFLCFASVDNLLFNW